MFPVGDDNVRGAHRPWVTWALIAVNVVVFLYELSLGLDGLQQLANDYGAVPVQIAQGKRLYTLVTSMFLHGGWLHIIGNMLFLAVFGDNIEATLGRLGYLIFYLAGGIVASLAQVWANPGANVPSIGASGAVAAVLGAYAVIYPTSRVRVLVVLLFWITITRVTALLFIGLWFVIQFFNGVASLGVQTAQTGGVAYWAHVGGFALGIVVGFLFRSRAPQLEREPSRRRNGPF
jgi:membrane associated rhomboid family serine protease